MRVAALAGFRVVGAVRSITVALPGQHAGQIGVPAVSGCFRQRDPGFPFVAEQAELDALGHLGKDREVGPGAVVAGAQRVRRARPHFRQPFLGAADWPDAGPYRAPGRHKYPPAGGTACISMITSSA